MAAKKKKADSTGKVIAVNKRGRFDFEIEDTFEAGLILVGTEVKALRLGRANIAESYATIENNEAMLINANFPIYAPASQFNHLPTRPRKLLMKRREINRVMGEIQKKGRTLVPLKLYFNEKGFIKLLLGIGVGKRNIDKRDTQKKRDWQKQKARLMREKG